MLHSYVEQNHSRRQTYIVGRGMFGSSSCLLEFVVVVVFMEALLSASPFPSGNDHTTIVSSP